MNASILLHFCIFRLFLNAYYNSEMQGILLNILVGGVIRFELFIVKYLNQNKNKWMHEEVQGTSAYSR